MKTPLHFVLLAVLALATQLHAQPAANNADIDNYQPGPDSKPQPDVPKGKTFSFPFSSSKIFPGTSRTITVYVPAQYKAEKPACVYVGLDGLGFGVPVVFDNLIHKGDMPVTIAIGVSPGSVAPASGKDNPRFNRSFEFDGLNDSLARMIVEEIFPAVEQQKTPDGLEIKLSKDPNDRCTGGGSTGGIAAFTLAWERPDLFRRVFSAIGTFVGMRGGDGYPVLVRKTEPKPIRVYQQDGSRDQWMGGPEVGDWWMSNQTLERALDFAGYEHEHVWGTGPHSGKHAAAIFPDAMRFLWKDWPAPVQAHPERTQNVVLKAILDPKHTWELVAEAGDKCDAVTANLNGQVFFRDTAAKKIRKLSTSGEISDAANIAADKAFAFNASGQVVTAGDLPASHVVVTYDDRLYATNAANGTLWLLQSDGDKVLLDEGLKSPSGLALSPDGQWLAVMEQHSPRGYSYRVLSDGHLDTKQRYYWFHVPDWADDSGAGSVAADRDGRLYVATNMGVQVFDRNGRSRGILPLPSGEATSVAFGGEGFKTLYVTSGGKLYRRVMQSVGAPAFLAPSKLPPWGAG